MKTVTNIIYLAFALIAFASPAFTPTLQAQCYDSDGFEVDCRNPIPGLRRSIGDFQVVEFWEHGNSAIGPEALSSNETSTGNFNTAVGVKAMDSTTTGSENTAVGFVALSKNIDGNRNTAVGEHALFSNTTGDRNTATGWEALKDNHAGVGNVADGARALANNNANYNTAVGLEALFSNTTGDRNTATGWEALKDNHAGVGNVADGARALANNNANYNTAVGLEALFSNTTGDRNTAAGANTLRLNATGRNNTATGADALRSNTTGNANTANGAEALVHNTTGYQNTANGFQALVHNTAGLANTAIGYQALFSNTTGSDNTALGNSAGTNVTTARNVIAIGHNVSGENVNNTCYIGNIFGATSAMGTAVYVNSLGKLGTVVSARRFKDEIQPMDKASEAILALKPVTFRYKKEIEPAGTSQFGLVAEDVERVNPNLVVRDSEGKVNTVRYEAVNAMLLNEFLKEHRKNEEQEATIAQLKKDFGATVAQLTARLDEQASQIQKVSAQLEASKPAPQVVNNP